MEKQINTREDYVDALITDFTHPQFQAAFRQYFGELGIQVKDWDALFREMDRGDAGEKNAAYVRTEEDGSVIGFIYGRHGYARAAGCGAKNQDEVLIKRLTR